jgi:hypothetical protein
MNLQSYSARVHTKEKGDFRALRDSNVLIYFPHGFGDWVQFSYVTRFLNPTNKYWITRYGDDNTSLMEGHDSITPLYLGVNTVQCDCGGDFSNRHFGLVYEEMDGGPQVLQLPTSLHKACEQNGITEIFWHPFPEIHGQIDLPYHTKPRSLIPELASPEDLQRVDLSRPLASTINFEVAPGVQSWVESRLMNFLGWGKRKLCVICRNGYTSVGKNWGHLFRDDLPPPYRYEGHECRQFMRLMLKKDPRWTFLIMEDRYFEGVDTVRDAELNAFSYAEIFGNTQDFRFPFGWMMKAILNCADLSVGVPSGPYHLSMAKRNLPTIGLWIQHLPSWYDEPSDSSIHLITRNLRDSGVDQRPGSFAGKDHLHYRSVELETRYIPAEQVLSAYETLVG